MFKCAVTSSTDSAHSEVHCSLAGGLKSGLLFLMLFNFFQRLVITYHGLQVLTTVRPSIEGFCMGTALFFWSRS